MVVGSHRMGEGDVTEDCFEDAALSRDDSSSSSFVESLGVDGSISLDRKSMDDVFLPKPLLVKLLFSFT